MEISVTLNAGSSELNKKKNGFSVCEVSSVFSLVSLPVVCAIPGDVDKLAKIARINNVIIGIKRLLSLYIIFK